MQNVHILYILVFFLYNYFYSFGLNAALSANGIFWGCTLQLMNNRFLN